MVLASMLAAPVSAFLCPVQWLYFFALYPAMSLAERKLAYFRNLFFMVLPPAAVFLWSILSDHSASALSSLRWACAVASGVYFAQTLGPGGIGYLLGIAGVKGLSNTMSIAGEATSAARLHWRENSDLPVMERAAAAVKNSLSGRESPQRADLSLGLLPVIVAVVSWLFLLVSISGRAG